MPSSCAAVVFDLGGVIVRITLDPLCAAKRAGVANESIAQSGIRHFGELPFFMDYQRGALDSDEYLRQLGSCFDLSPAAATLLHAAIILEEYPGIAELMANLNGAGVRTGILSNTNKLHWEEMGSGRWPTFEAAQVRLGSHEVRLEKPDRAFYDLMASRLGVNPDEIVFFDDGIGKIEGARAAGWQAHLIDPTGDPAAQIRDCLGLGVG